MKNMSQVRILGAEPLLNTYMLLCSHCDKVFKSALGLAGHKRMHGPSNGSSTKILCSCIITRKVMAYQYLEKYQESLIDCKTCSKKFKPILSRTTFCSKSCAAIFNNKKYVKRKKIIKTLKIVKVKKVYTKKELSSKNVAAVQAYRARKRNAILPDTNLILIREIYKHCPIGYEVDHVIALSEGGSHHQDNLQYLPALINRKKNRGQNYDRSFAIKWQDVLKISSK